MAIIERETLVPCSFCRSKDIGLDSGLYSQMIFAYCKTCKKSGPHLETKEQAIEAWNNRAEPPKDKE